MSLLTTILEVWLVLDIVTLACVALFIDGDTWLAEDAPEELDSDD